MPLFRRSFGVLRRWWVWTATLVLSALGRWATPPTRLDQQPVGVEMDAATRVVERYAPPPLFAFSLGVGKFGMRDRRLGAALRLGGR
jgi:hypothetical protein